MPSFIEGYPKVLAEAIAFGTFPIISEAGGGARENEKSNILRWRKRVRVIPESLRFKEPKINLMVRQKLYRAVFEGKQVLATYKKRGANV